MRILFVWTAAEYATHDVARGYRGALQRQGHVIRDYKLNKRMAYHARALGKPNNLDVGLVSRLASENVLIEAIRHRAELVVVISGLVFHPDGVWFLARCGIRTATLFTESPYDDEKQYTFATVHPEMICATQERTSATQYGWRYLRPAYDPQVHRPGDPDPAEACDVLMIGTGWPERQELLEQVDWTGIRLRLIGTWHLKPKTEDDGDVWPQRTGRTGLDQYIETNCIDNPGAVPLYWSAKICLNMHRAHPTAESLNPRAMELAACGAFQISDRRAEVTELFDGSVPTFGWSARELEGMIRHYLSRPHERATCARNAQARVQGETFDERAQALMSAL
tara:strand:- start:21484 stop:22494 length:1011 start_codon:yes stop_codon:yes gene_type:complete